MLLLQGAPRAFDGEGPDRGAGDDSGGGLQEGDPEGLEVSRPEAQARARPDLGDASRTAEGVRDRVSGSPFFHPIV